MTRPRGFADYEPRNKARELFELIRSVLAEYRGAWKGARNDPLGR